MKYSTLMVLAATLMGPMTAWAGIHTVSTVPVLGDIGLIALGVGLVGTGVAFLRRR